MTQRADLVKISGTESFVRAERIADFMEYLEGDRNRVVPDGVFELEEDVFADWPLDRPRSYEVGAILADI